MEEEPWRKIKGNKDGGKRGDEEYRRNRRNKNKKSMHKEEEEGRKIGSSETKQKNEKRFLPNYRVEGGVKWEERKTAQLKRGRKVRNYFGLKRKFRFLSFGRVPSKYPSEICK